MTIAATAATMLNNGYTPIEIKTGEKIPVREGWQTTTPEQAAQLASKMPDNANIGILCGDKVTIVDFDKKGNKPTGRDVYDELMQGAPEIFRGAVIEETPSGGVHATYRGMPGEKTYCRFKHDDGRKTDIEVLRGNHQAVAPPSKTDKGAYTYLSDRTHLNTPRDSLPELPQVFREAIMLYEKEEGEKRAKSPVSTTTRADLEELNTADWEVLVEASMEDYLRGASETHRHDHALAYSKMLAGCGLNSREVERAVDRFFGRTTRQAHHGEIVGIIRDAERNPDRDPAVPWQAIWEARRRRDDEHLKILDAAFPSSANSDAAARALARGEEALRKGKKEQAQAAQQREVMVEADAKTAVKRKEDTPAKAWKLCTIADAYEDRPAIKYAVGKMIEIPSVNMIVAPPGHHKTNIAISMAVHIATGKPWLPQDARHDTNALVVPSARPVLFMDQDGGQRRTADRIAEFARGLDAPDDTPFYYVSMPCPPFIAGSTMSIKLLSASIDASKAEVVFIDTFGSTIGNADENSAEMLLVMKALRDIAENKKVGVVVLHHQNKRQGDGQRGGDRIRGFSGIEGGLDNAFLIEKSAGDDTMITIMNVKARGEKTPDITAQYWRGKTPEGKPTAGFKGFGVGNRSDLTHASQCLAVYDIIQRNGPMNQKTLISYAQGQIMKGKKAVGRDGVVDLLTRMISENKLAKKPGPKMHEFLYVIP